MLVLILGKLREVQPELGHAEPVGVRFDRVRRSGERQAALGADPEFVAKFHIAHTHYAVKRASGW
jgi:hypothetical protein